MSLNLRGNPVDELNKATHVVSDVPCGVISIVLVGDGTNAATVKLYNHASAVSGNVKKGLAIAASATNVTAVYCPCKPDSFSTGCVAVVTGDNAVAYIEIE